MRPKYLILVFAIASLSLVAPPPTWAQASPSETPPSPVTPPAGSLGANAGGKRADPEPADQAGFPHDLYRWVLPADNLGASA